MRAAASHSQGTRHSPAASAQAQTEVSMKWCAVPWDPGELHKPRVPEGYVHTRCARWQRLAGCALFGGSVLILSSELCRARSSPQHWTPHLSPLSVIQARAPQDQGSFSFCSTRQRQGMPPWLPSGLGTWAVRPQVSHLLWSSFSASIGWHNNPWHWGSL